MIHSTIIKNKDICTDKFGSYIGSILVNFNIIKESLSKTNLSLFL